MEVDPISLQIRQNRKRLRGILFERHHLFFLTAIKESIIFF
jgi:hypothetical protein